MPNANPNVATTSRQVHKETCPQRITATLFQRSANVRATFAERDCARWETQLIKLQLKVNLV